MNPSLDRDHQHLIDLLSEARERAGLTQSELAVKLGEPQSFISKYERGNRRLDVLEVILIARELGLKPASLVGKLDRTIPARKNRRRSQRRKR